MERTSLEIKAETFAIKAHTSTNHMYGRFPYYVHLVKVIEEAKYFINLIPEEDRGIVLASCWLHDIIEDCRLTYNDINKEFGHGVAELVYALTNDKGKNRAERAGDKYYSGIRNTKYATFIKLCDRLANVNFSITEGDDSMFAKYAKENENFIYQLHNYMYEQMFNKLYDIFRLNGGFN